MFRECVFASALDDAAFANRRPIGFGFGFCQGADAAQILLNRIESS